MKIIWSDSAIFDLESIRDFIAKDSIYYASQFIEKIINSVEKLVNFPEMGRSVPEVEDNFIRELLFQNYRIIYKLEKSKIFIITVIHQNRDLNKKPIKPWDII